MLARQIHYSQHFVANRFALSLPVWHTSLMPRGNTPYFISYLLSKHSERCDSNPQYSLRAFARSLKVDPGTLSAVINGKKPLSLSLSHRLIESLDCAPDEKELFIQSVVEAQNKRDLKRKDPKIKNFISQSVRKTQSLSLDIYRIIADWYHAAILEMTFISDIKINAKTVAKKLGITQLQAKSAIDRLVDLELIEENDNSYKKTGFHLKADKQDVTLPALKKKQKQIRQKAIESIDSQPIEERVMTSVTMAIDPEKIPQARKMIDEFNDQLCSFLESGERKEIYVFENSLFSLQKKEEIK